VIYLNIPQHGSLNSVMHYYNYFRAVILAQSEKSFCCFRTLVKILCYNSGLDKSCAAVKKESNNILMHFRCTGANFDDWFVILKDCKECEQVNEMDCFLSTFNYGIFCFYSFLIMQSFQ